MEMCYDGALVMPSSYAVMSEEEMMYLEGGAFKWKTVGKSLKNLYYKYKWAPRALSCGGITLGAICNMAKGIAIMSKMQLAVALGSAVAANALLGTLAIAGTVATVTYLGTKVRFK